MATDDTTCDVLIVCALEKEARAVLDVISTHCDVMFTAGYIRANRREYRKATIVNDRGEQLDVHVSWAPKKGPEEMALHLPALMSECHPRFVGMTGICAGDRLKTALGNIIVGEMAFLSDTGKFIEDEFGRQVHQHNATPWHPNQTTLQYARLFDDWIELVKALPRPPSRRQQRDWLIDQLLENPEISIRSIRPTELSAHAPDYRQIVEEMKNGPTPILTPELKLTDFGLQTDRFLQLGHIDKPECERQVAPIASGNAVHADQPFADAQIPVRDTIGLEMEGATFYRVVHDYPGVHSLLVKSVCDYADPEKDDSYHDYAAKASAFYMLSFIQQYVNEELMPSPIRAKAEDRPVPPLPSIPADPPFFTGRDPLLAQIRQMLLTPAHPQPVALTGMGGEGKTCCATRCCHQHSDDYEKIFWVQAQSDTTLRDDFAKIAAHLQLPEAKETDQDLAVNAVKRWLAANTNWLLVLDNADDNLSTACGYLPDRYEGHVLITTQPRAVGVYARAISLPLLSPEDGALLLLRRAKLLSGDEMLSAAKPEHRTAALEIVAETVALPLALDQAGAYIEEANVSPSKYLNEFRVRAAELLSQRGEMADPNHKSVTVTFSLAFDKVIASNADAANLLRCTAFLAPTNIPESIFTQGGPHFGSLWSHASTPSLWEKICGEACRYSLLIRDGENESLSIHRLVQIVISDTIHEVEQVVWKSLAIHVLSQKFPSFHFKYWQSCNQMMPHALRCINYIKEHNIVSYETGILLVRVASYLDERAQYSQAETLYTAAIQALTATVGSEHYDTISSINNLAFLYKNQSRFAEAEKLFLEAKEIHERLLGHEASDTLICITNLASLYRNQGRHSEAEALYLQIQEIRERVFGIEDRDTLNSINNLAMLYDDQGRYNEAENLHLLVRKIREKEFGINDPDTISSINNLAVHYNDQERYDEAILLYLEAKERRGNILGPEHPDTLASINNLASCYGDLGQFDEAQKLHLHVKNVQERILGTEHPDTLGTNLNLAILYADHDRFTESEAIYTWLIPTFEKNFGLEHPQTKEALRGQRYNLRHMEHSTGRR